MASRFVRSVVKTRLLSVAAVVAVSLVLSWVLLPKVEYLPNGNRNLVIAIVIPPPGYNLNQLTKMGEVVEQALQPYWDVDANSPELDKLPYPAVEDFFYVARNRQVFVGVRAMDGERSAELVPLIQSFADKLPGTILVAKQASLFEQGLTAGRTVEIEITGPEIHHLVDLGGEIFGMLKGGGPKPGLMPDAQIRPNPSLDLKSPEVRVIPKWDQAADMGVSAADLGYAVDTMIDGAYATDYYSGGDRIDLRIMIDTKFEQTSQHLASIPVSTPSGQLVPLAAVANIEFSSGPEQINHRTRQRAVTLEVTPPPQMPLEAAMDMINAEIIQKFQASGRLDGGYRLSLAGTADKLRSTWASLKWNLLLAVLLTYLLMAATFESWLYPFVVILTVPLGAIGGFAGLWILNWYVYQPLDVLTMLGFIMLVGTVVNNPILIVEQSLVHMRVDGMGTRQAILESVRNRIRPIFMTTLGGLVGLLPLVVAPGAGSELYRGIGAVLLGGLLLSTALTLVFVPALLGLTMEAREKVWAFFRRSAESQQPATDSLRRPAAARTLQEVP
jgi:HAE1 family hydrophobic/amphiphilic exporter-1